MENIDKYHFQPDLVKRQLLQILTSNGFRNSQVLSMFLQFVVEETLADRANEIKEYTIGVRALGRPADFNPQIDAVVRIHAGRLRRMLHEYYHEEGLNDAILIEIPKGSYIPVFELRTPAPLQTMPEADMPRTETRSKQRATIAVFPFHNFGSDETKNYFINGIGEQLCNDLAKFQHLSVISYYSTNEFIHENRSMREIQRLLDTDYMITGSIRFLDGVIQINIQLMYAKDETLIWTKTYMRHFSPENLYSLQDDIIEHVLNEIGDYDGIITKNILQTLSTRNKNVYGVYEAVYLYYSYGGKFTPETLHQVRSALEQASETEPQNSLIWALLAKIFLYGYISKPSPSIEDLEKGTAYAAKAISLDRYCQHSYKALALSNLFLGKKEECMDAIERCLELNNKSLVMTGTTGFLMICLGKYEQGFQLLLKAFQLNPSLPWFCNLGFALYYYHVANYEEADNWIERNSSYRIPLISIVRLAISGKTKNRQISEGDTNGEMFSQSTEITNSGDIIKQFILDDKMRKKLQNGLKLAGVVVE